MEARYGRPHLLAELEVVQPHQRVDAVPAPGPVLFEVRPRTRSLVGAVLVGVFVGWGCAAMPVGLYIGQEWNRPMVGVLVGVVLVAAGGAVGYVFGRLAARRRFIVDAAGLHLRDGFGRHAFVPHDSRPRVEFMQKGQANLAIVHRCDGPPIRASALAGTRAFRFAGEANAVLRACQPTTTAAATVDRAEAVVPPAELSPRTSAPSAPAVESLTFTADPRTAMAVTASQVKEVVGTLALLWVVGFVSAHSPPDLIALAVATVVIGVPLAWWVRRVYRRTRRPVVVDGDGIHVRDKVILWGDVDDIRASDGHIVIVVDGRPAQMPMPRQGAQWSAPQVDAIAEDIGGRWRAVTGTR